MDALTPFVPAWGTAEEWNDAYEKVENYLRAFRVESRLHRARLIQRVLQRIADRGQPADGTPLTTLAIQEVQAMIQEWFGKLMQEPSSDAQGRLGLLLCDGQTRWPYCFLEPDRVPEEMVAKMQKAMLRAGPDLAVSNMVPREIDLGMMSEFVGDALETFQTKPLIRAAILWAFLLGLLAFLFWYTR
jgi:hypothetical protein